MQTFTGEVGIVVAATGLFLLLTFFIVLVVLIQQQQYHRQRRERAALKNQYEQELLRTQIEIQEQTMQSVSEEIHDNIGQVLALVKINLSTLPGTDDPTIAEKLSQSKAYLTRAIADLRNLSRTLNAEARLSAGLASAIRADTEAIGKTGLLETHFSLQGEEVRLEAHQELILFRTTQELLHNVLKHAQARQVAVSLNYGTDRLTLSIADDGIGFDPHLPPRPSGVGNGSGLTNLRSRARLIGADFQIRSASDRGTLATLTLGLPRPAGTSGGAESSGAVRLRG